MLDIKRITIRVSPALYQQVSQAAHAQKVSLNAFVSGALEAYVRQQKLTEGRWPLQELSALLAPAAEAGSLTEEELMQHVHEVRQRIWEERYQRAVQAVETGTM